MTLRAALCMPKLPACLPATASAEANCESSRVHETYYMHKIWSCIFIKLWTLEF